MGRGSKAAAPKSKGKKGPVAQAAPRSKKAPAVAPKAKAKAQGGVPPEAAAKAGKPAKVAKVAKPAARGKPAKAPKPEAVEAAPLPAAAVASPESAPVHAKPARRATAETMASRQRDISVSEFFTKNRHLLGFDNPAKSLLTTVKEAVDNALDACEEAGILPDVIVEIKEVSEGRFRVAIEDNGPGIVKPQIPKIFAKLLYGSKFHRLKQSRGQQGIGISAAGLYGQLTTGRPVVIVSKTGKGRPAFKIDLRIDTKRNQPDVVGDATVEWPEKDHGTRVEIELVAAYRGGRTGVDAYLEQTVVANPHMELTYVTPKGEKLHFPRVSNELPREAQEIKPHPHGVELGMLLSMLNDSEKKSVKQVLIDDFSRVSPAIAEEVCKIAKVPAKTPASSIHSDQAEALHKALSQVRVMAPPASCVVPVGEELLKAGLRRRYPNAEFAVSTTRPPSVYRGNPFVVEVALAYGGDLPFDEPADVMRFANRVPLQYQPKSCAISEAVYDTNWKSYELAQPKGSLPVGPLAIVVHLASVWVPFTSEAKEAVAHYDDLLREMKLALQECGRKLASHLRARARAEGQMKRLSLFQRYIPEVAGALSTILGRPKDKIEVAFHKALPNFVQIAEEEASPSEPPPAGSMPPPPAGEGGSMAPPALPKGAAAPKGKAKAKGKAKGKDDNDKKKGATKSVAAAVAESPRTAKITPPAWPPPAPPAGKGKGKGKAPNKAKTTGKKGEQLTLV